MAKYKKSLMKKIHMEQEEEQKQKRLHEKYEIEDQMVRIVERNNMGKFLVRTIGRCIRIIAAVAVCILAAIGLTALLYPEVRQELFQVFEAVFLEGRNLLGVN